MATQLKAKLNELLHQKKITRSEFKKILDSIADPWEEALGILKRKKINAVRYQKEMRKEWNR